jgi:hypothetical protein
VEAGVIVDPREFQPVVTRWGAKDGAFVEGRIVNVEAGRFGWVKVAIEDQGQVITLARRFDEIWEVDEGLQLALQEAAGEAT